MGYTDQSQLRLLRQKTLLKGVVTSEKTTYIQPEFVFEKKNVSIFVDSCTFQQNWEKILQTVIYELKY